MTNREKFKEVFGADPIQDGWGGYCPPPKMHKCNFATRECRQCMGWWNKPYEEPKGGKYGRSKVY